MREGLFFQKEMTAADVDARIWQMILRARMDRRQSDGVSGAGLTGTVPDQIQAGEIRRPDPQELLKSRTRDTEIIDLTQSSYDEELSVKKEAVPASYMEGTRKWKGKGKETDPVD